MSIISNHLLTAQFYPHSNPSLGVTREPVSVTGPAYKGAGYYGGNEGIHTIQYSVTNFIGTMEIQASLCLDPSDADWFTVKLYNFPNRHFDQETDIVSAVDTFQGKYTFVRAKITYTFGSVGVIQMIHQ